MLGHSERTRDFRIALVRIRPVDFGYDIRKRLRGGRGFAFRGGERAARFDIADGECSDERGKEN